MPCGKKKKKGRYLFILLAVLLTTVSAWGDTTPQMAPFYKIQTPELTIKSGSDTAVLTPSYGYYLGHSTVSTLQTLLAQYFQSSELKLLVNWESPSPTNATTEWDYSGSSNAFTYNNTDATDDEKHSYGARFITLGGTNEYLNRADDADFQIGGVPFAWFGWIKVYDVPTAAMASILAKHDDGTGYEWSISLSATQKITFEFISDTDVAGTYTTDTYCQALYNTTIPVGIWYFIVITKTSHTAPGAGNIDSFCENFNIYIDGTSVTVSTLGDLGAGSTYTDTTAGITLGYHDDTTAPANGEYFTGSIGLMGFANNDSLSQAEVTELYNATRGLYGK